MTNDVVTVSKRDGTLTEPLTSLINSSFNVSWENNSSYQLTFTAFDDKSVSFALLTSENIITWRGQQFVIKQSVPNYSARYATIAITATHIYLDVRKIFRHNKKAGTLTYSVRDVLAFYLDNNNFGYTYDVQGSFSNQQITDLGGNNTFDGLSQIISTWSEAIIYPDNKKIVVYSKDAFAKNLGNRLGYGHNTDNMTLTYDSTALVNQLTVISATKEDGSVWFQPHIINNPTSISKYGVIDGGDFSDDRFHDVNAADAAARAKLVTEPAVTVTLDYLDNDKPVPGEIRRLEILETGFVTDVMVVAYAHYPLDSSQKTSLTLNSNPQTVLDYQRSNRNILNQAQQNTLALSNAIRDANDKLNVLTSDGMWYTYGGNING